MAEQPHKIHLLSPYLEGELTRTQRKTVELHLRACAYCRQELSLLRRAIDALEEVPLEKTPADFLVKLKRRLDQATPSGHAGELHSQRQVPAAHAPLSARRVPSGLRAPSWLKPLVSREGNHGRFLLSPLTMSLAALVVGLMFTLFFLCSPRDSMPARPEQAGPGIGVQARPPSAASSPPAPQSRTLAEALRPGSLPLEDASPGVEPAAVSSRKAREDTAAGAGSPTRLAYDKE